MHQRRYAGRLVDDDQHGPHVQWDLIAGSDDQLLATTAAREPA